MQISVSHNLSSVALAYKDLADKYVNQATVRALNKTAITVRAEAARKVGREYNIKIGAAKSQMWITQANRGQIKASITVSGRPIPLIEFDARRAPGGVSVKIKGTRKVLRGFFIAKMPTGHIGVYSRTGAFGRRNNPKLEKIRQRYSLSLPVAFSQKQIVDALLSVASNRFAETLRQEIRFAQLKAA